MNDIDIALGEMTQTEEAIQGIEISDQFRNELHRIRSDLGVSPFVNLTDDMVKWVLLANARSLSQNR